MKRILCYGDSNTWGYIPGTARRYPRNVRWTGVMAAELGDGYQVDEAGLNGRTTIFDDPFNPLLNGLKYFPVVLMQAKPLDLVIISLGTNDLKLVNVHDSARGVGKLAEICKQANESFAGSSPVLNPNAKILLVSPIAVGECFRTVDPYTRLFPDSHEQSLQYAEDLRRIASNLGVEFFDAASVAVPSKTDGVHMEPESHLALGKALAKKVLEIL